jgi:hypothetical protein
LDDITAIHIRSLLCTFTNINPFTILSSTTPFSDKICLFISISTHIILYILFIHHIYDLREKKIAVHFSDNNQYISTLIGVPLLVDSFIIIFNETNIANMINMLIIKYIQYYIIFKQPFGQASQLAFHVGIFVQVMAICSANVTRTLETIFHV